MKKKTRSPVGNQQGVSAVLVIIGMLAFIGLLAFAIDLGHLHVVENELRNAAEAGALAGARALYARDPYHLSDDLLTPVTEPLDCTGVSKIASDKAKANYSDGKEGEEGAFSVSVQMVRWNWTTNRPSPSVTCSLDPDTGINGFTVIASRSREGAAGGVFLTLGKLFGKETMDVTAWATAAVGYTTGLPPGSMWQIAIQWDFLQKVKAGDPSIPSDGPSFFMNPDKLDNGGFCGTSQPSAKYLKDAIDGKAGGLSTTDEVLLTNGLIGSVHMELDKAIANHSWTDSYGNIHYGEWLVALPVVDVDKFNQKTGLYSPQPLQPIILEDVLKPGDKDNPTNDWAIKFRLYDGPVSVGGGEPGGPVSTLLATRPKLVDVDYPR